MQSSYSALDSLIKRLNGIGGTKTVPDRIMEPSFDPKRGSAGSVSSEELESAARLRMPSGCPMGFSLTTALQQHLHGEGATDDPTQEGCNKVEESDGVTYGEYLRLDKLLDAQELQSKKAGCEVADEHLFIITHQAYELWFRQILYDLDRVRAWFNTPIVDETKMLYIVQLLERIVRILKLLADQMLILETMSPLDFIEFRSHLAPASGFQSLQFRLLENKLGVASEKRVWYNAQHYRNVFRQEGEKSALEQSETEASLLQLVEKWLERTPGVSLGEDGTMFWQLYTQSVHRYLDDLRQEERRMAHSAKKAALANAEMDKMQKTFESILDEDKHLELVRKGERRLSHAALQGALLIYFYRDNPRFGQPYLILTLLMDIDSLITKWRYNHVMLVQRQLGSKQGTGGSSGYHYLRSTIADRYKVFLDLFNLSTFLLPRAYIPELTPSLHARIVDVRTTHQSGGSTASSAVVSEPEEVKLENTLLHTTIVK